MYDLRILDPVTDLAHFETAYNWRTRPRTKLQPDRMPFETFASTDPRHMTIGAFNGQLEAVFFFHEFGPKQMECHFTSRRGVSRETLLLSAREIVRLAFENGVEELVAWIVPRNRPLRSFVEALGFTLEGTESFPKRKSENCCTVSETEEFVKYAITRPVP